MFLQLAFCDRHVGSCAAAHEPLMITVFCAQVLNIHIIIRQTNMCEAAQDEAGHRHTCPDMRMTMRVWYRWRVVARKRGGHTAAIPEEQADTQSWIIRMLGFPFWLGRYAIESVVGEHVLCSTPRD